MLTLQARRHGQFLKFVAVSTSTRPGSSGQSRSSQGSRGGRGTGRSCAGAPTVCILIILYTYSLAEAGDLFFPAACNFL